MEKPSKTELRKKYLELRNRLDPMERLRQSSAIRQSIVKNPKWQDAGTVLAYVSAKSEVETQKLLETALEQNKRLVVPVLNPSRQELSFSELKATGDLQPGHYKWILEPAKEYRVDVESDEIDLVLAPGVVFDRWGGRIGLGGGYFDKALAQMPRAYKIGLAFAQQVCPEALPLEGHDVRMNAIATDQQWIEIGGDTP